jgi:hypothetical protein
MVLIIQQIHDSLGFPLTFIQNSTKNSVQLNLLMTHAEYFFLTE